MDDTGKVRQAFDQLRETLFAWNRKSKASWGTPAKMRCESGMLQGQRPYFFMQPWNQMGFLFEMTQRGWVIARAERIISSEQFMRERSAFDHVVLYEASELQGALRVRSEQLGEELTSLSLYEDALLRLFNDGYAGSKAGII